jgi:hypothetical protein
LASLCDNQLHYARLSICPNVLGFNKTLPLSGKCAHSLPVALVECFSDLFDFAEELSF